jgi:hypothetical protein
MIRAALASLLLIGHVHAAKLDWSPVTTAVDGSNIPALVIYYRVYWSLDDVDWNYAADTGDTEMSLNSITEGCFYLYVTAVRSDTDQESVPSQSVRYCAGDLDTPNSTSPPSEPIGVLAI